MAKKKTSTIDSQISKAMLSNQPNSIADFNKLATSKESNVKTGPAKRTLPVVKTSEGDLKINATDAQISSFLKGEMGIVSNTKKEAEQRDAQKDAEKVFRLFGDRTQVNSDITKSPIYTGTEKTKAPSTIVAGENLFQKASENYAKNQILKSPYYGKTYQELSLMKNSANDKDGYQIDLWRVGAANSSELEEMLKEAEENYKKYSELYKKAQVEGADKYAKDDGTDPIENHKKIISGYKEKEEQNSSLISAIKNRISEDKAAEEQKKNFLKWGKIAVDSGKGNEYSPDNSDYDYNAINRYFGNGKPDAQELSLVGRKNYMYLSEGELRLYNTLHNADKKMANEYLKSMGKTLAKRASDAAVEQAEDFARKSPVAGGLVSAAGDLATGAVSAIDNIVDKLIKGEVDTYDASGRASRVFSAMRSAGTEEVRRKHGETSAVIYDTGMEVAKLAMDIALAKGIGKLAGVAGATDKGIRNAQRAVSYINMGGRAASGTMISVADRGGNDAQIITSGIASALLEIGTEALPFEQFLNPKVTKGFIKTIGTSATSSFGSNALEESVASAGNMLLDAIIMQGQSENDIKRREYVKQGMSAEEAAKKVLHESIIQIATEGAMGGVVGGIMGGVTAGSAYASRKSYIAREGERLLQNPKSLNMILSIGIENKNADAIRGASQLINDGAEISKKEAGKILESVITESISQNGGIANIINLISAIEGRDAEYIGSRESIDTARAVMHFVNESANDADKAMLQQSNGAVTLLTAIEGDAKAWKSIKEAAVKDSEYRASRGFEEMQNAEGGMQNDESITFESENNNTEENYEEDLPFSFDEEVAKENDEIEAPETQIEEGDTSATNELNIPRGSAIENNIVSDEFSQSLKANNPRAYNNISRMAKRLGMNVRFVKNLTNAEGDKVDGLITNNGIFIDADAKNPARFVATHEFGHRMRQAAGKEWKAYTEYVVETLKREKFSDGSTKYDTIFEEKRASYGKDKSADYINEEIAADFAGELFRNEAELEAFIRNDKRLALKVRDMWYKILESLGLLDEKKKAQQMWLKAYTAAGKNVEEGKVGDYEGGKAKIVTMSDGSGRKYVKATQRVIKSKNPNMWESEIMNYVNSVVRNGEDVVIPLDNEESIFITGRTAWKLSGKGKVGYDYYFVKGNAAGVIDEIIQISKEVDSAPPYKEHKNGFAKYGFDYRIAYFMDVDGKYYKLKLSVGINADGKEAYDIENINRTTFPSPGSRAHAFTAARKSSSKPMVTQKKPTVNNNSMQKSENDSQEGRSSIPGTRLSDIEARRRAETLEEENKRLRGQLENLSLQLNIAEGKALDTKAIKKAAQDIRRSYGSKISVAALHQELVKLYNYMAGRDVSADEVASRINAIAKSVIDNATEKVESSEFADLLDTIKNTRIEVPESDKKDFGDGYEHFRKRSMGKLKLVKDGYPLDALWDDLVDEYPYLFTEEYVGSEERLNRILEVREELLPVEENIYKTDADFERAVKALENDIMESFFKIPEGGDGKYVFYDKRADIADKILKEREKEFADKIAKLDREYTYKLKKAEEQRDRYRDRFSKDKLKKKIDSDYRYISKMLLEPTDQRHVPDRIRADVAALLDCFSFETKHTDRLRDEGKEMESVTAVKLSELHDAYSAIMKRIWNISSEDKENNLLDQMLSEDLLELKEEFPVNERGEFKRIEDMTPVELWKVSNVLKGIHHAITSENKAFNTAVKESISVLGDDVMSEMRSVRDSRKRNKYKTDENKTLIQKAVRKTGEFFNYENVQPWDVFHQFGGTLERLYMEERKSFNRHIKNIRKASKMIADATKGMNLENLTGKDADVKEFTLLGGEKIQLTKGKAMSLYALYRREQGRNHILYGGIITNEASKDAEGEKRNVQEVHELNEIDAGKIFEWISDEEKAMIEKVVEFMTKECAKWGNETSMKLYGYEKYGEGWYFPIKVSKASLPTFYGEGGEGTIRRPGFENKLKKNATNPIEINDFFDTVTEHINGMSLYNTIAVPMLDMERVLNHTQYITGERPENVRGEIIRTFGAAAENYIKLFHKDLNGSRKAPDKDSTTETLVSNVKKASIGMNLRVLLQQFASIARALLFLNPKDFPAVWKGLSLIDEMQEKVPIAYWKSKGFRDIGTGRSMKDVILDSESLYDKVAMGAYGVADDFAWSILYGAVKNEIKRKNPEIEYESAEFFEKVQERFDYIVDRSQVVDSVFHRTENMRSKNPYKKTATMFMSEPLKTYNMYRTEVLDAMREGKTTKRLSRATAVYIVSNLLLAVAQALPDTWREDDEKKLFDEEGKEISVAKRYLKNIWENMVDNSNPATYIPYIKDIVSLINGFTLERMEYSGISDLITMSKQILNPKIAMPQKIINVARTVSAVLGYSYGNLIRDAKGIASSVYRAFGDEYADYMIVKFSWNVKNPDNKAKFMNHYKRALANGNGGEAALILADYMAENFKGQNFRSDKAKTVSDEMSKVYEKTKKSSVLYNIPDQEFEHKGEKVKISDKDYPEYVSGAYDILWDMAYEMVKSEEYASLSEDEKAEAFGDLKNYSQKIQREKYVDGYEIEGWQKDIKSGEMTFPEHLAEGKAKREYNATRDKYLEEFDFDVAGLSEDEAEAFEDYSKAAARYYAQKEHMPEKEGERYMRVYDDELSEEMGLDEFLENRAKAKKTAAMEDGKPSLNKDELIEYLESTNYSRSIKSALFSAIGNSNWKNPY